MSDIETAVQAERTPRRRQTIAEAAAAYQDWFESVRGGYFPVAAVDWAEAGAQVRVNPEVGLIIGGVRHVVKLHFKKTDELTEADAAIMTTVMRTALTDSCGEDCLMCVLDARRGRLFVEPQAESQRLPQLIDAASDLGARWDQAA